MLPLLPPACHRPVLLPPQPLAVLGQVKAKRGETKRGLHKWLEKHDGESVLRAHCLRYLCDHSYVSGSEIKQERKRRREERSGAQ